MGRLQGQLEASIHQTKSKGGSLDIINTIIGRAQANLEDLEVHNRNRLARNSSKKYVGSMR
jgi:hypothetical protein